MRTDRGRRRPGNEDAYFDRPEAGVFAVADGMGGHAAGEVASGLAVETLARAVDTGHSRRYGARRIARLLREAVEQANRVIYAQGLSDPARAGMGTTFTGLALVSRGHRAVLAHVGDSRAYCLRHGDLTQLTHDHTWVQAQVDAGMMSPLQARHHPFSSVLTRALGTEPWVEVDEIEVPLLADDLILLCSDGLTAMFEDDELRDRLAGGGPLDRLAERLIEEGNARGGVDNITVLLIRILD